MQPRRHPARISLLRALVSRAPWGPISLELGRHLNGAATQVIEPWTLSDIEWLVSLRPGKDACVVFLPPSKEVA